MTKIDIGNVQLFVVDQGAGQPIVLVHGFPLDHTMWQPQIDALGGNFRVIAPDLRGFGRSDVTPGTVTMEQFADDMARLLDALQIDEPVTFCGLSMGGYIGWQFWRRHRGRLARLIQCDTRAIADSEEGRQARLSAADDVLAIGPDSLVETMLPRLFAERRLFSEETQTNNHDIVQSTRRVMAATSREGIAAAQRGMAARPDVTQWLPQIDVPTLLVCGEHDAISPPAEMRTIAQAIPAAQFVEIPAAGHMTPLENSPAVNLAIDQFLA